MRYFLVLLLALLMSSGAGGSSVNATRRSVRTPRPVVKDIASTPCPYSSRKVTHGKEAAKRPLEAGLSSHLSLEPKVHGTRSKMARVEASAPKSDDEGSGSDGNEDEGSDGDEDEGSDCDEGEANEAEDALDRARNKSTTIEESTIIIRLYNHLKKFGLGERWPDEGIVASIAQIVNKSVRTIGRIVKCWKKDGDVYDAKALSGSTGRKAGWRLLDPLSSMEMNAFIRETIVKYNKPPGKKAQAITLTFRKLHHEACKKFGLLSKRPAVALPDSTPYLPYRTFVRHCHKMGVRKCKGRKQNPLKFEPSTQLRVEFFLRRYHKLIVEPTEAYARDRTQPKPPIEIYFDEAAFSENHGCDYSLFIGKDKFIKRKHGKGKRLMIEHCLVYVPGCYNDDGKPRCFLLPGAQLSITNDGHIEESHYKNVNIKSKGTLDSKLFDVWAENTAQLIRALYPVDVAPIIVAIFDNAGVHSVNVADCWEHDKCPSSARKQQIKDWLEKHIELPTEPAEQQASLDNPTERHMWNTWNWWVNATRDELMEYALVVRGGPVYRLDEAFKKRDITTCRTPPYYPEWQPIEYVWGFLKNFVYITSEYAGEFNTLQTFIDAAYDNLHSDQSGILAGYREHCQKRILKAHALLPPSLVSGQTRNLPLSTMRAAGSDDGEADEADFSSEDSDSGSEDTD